MSVEATNEREEIVRYLKRWAGRLSRAAKNLGGSLDGAHDHWVRAHVLRLAAKKIDDFAHWDEADAKSMPKEPKKVKLSPAQWKMLDSAVRFGDYGARLRGQAQHGGAYGTRLSLMRLKLLDDSSKPTKAGKSRHAEGA